jgi:tetratricopeptide (TPR) repeat protein
MFGMKRSWRISAAGLAVSFVLGGCASQRPLVEVRDDADKSFARGEYDRALSSYVEYVGRRPGDAEMQHRLAETLLVLKQPAQAVEHAWRAFDLDPSRDEHIETLAQAMAEAGQSADLYSFLRDQTQSRGRVTDYLRLGRYSAAGGDADSAELAFKTAAELDKGRTLAPQLALADFYRRIGDKPGEVSRLRMALYLDPGSPDINARLRELGEIPGPSFAIKPSEAP